MRNRLPFLFGMDCWRLKIPLTFFLNQCLRQDIEVMELKLTPEGLVFWSPVTSRRRITSLFQDAECLGTSGVTGFLLHQFHQPLRLFSVALAAALWMFYSHCIVQVSVTGTDPTLQRQIEQQLAENGYAIRRESLVRDRGFLYPVIEAGAGEMHLTLGRQWAGADLLYDPLGDRYIIEKIIQLQAAAAGSNRASAPEARERGDYARAVITELLQMREEWRHANCPGN